jgi:hypothetical protein
VEDEGVGEAVRAVCAGEVEARSVDLAHDIRNFVADCFGAAVVLIGRDGGHIERAMPECAESEGTMADVGLVLEHHFHNPDVANDGSADRGNEQENGRDEDERGADNVKPAKHDCGVVEIVCWGGIGLLRLTARSRCRLLKDLQRDVKDN